MEMLFVMLLVGHYILKAFHHHWPISTDVDDDGVLCVEVLESEFLGKELVALPFKFIREPAKVYEWVSLVVSELWGCLTFFLAIGPVRVVDHKVQPFVHPRYWVVKGRLHTQ